MKIFAIGMNYAQHNKEMDGALYKPEEPVVFLKADSSLLKDRNRFSCLKSWGVWTMRRNS